MKHFDGWSCETCLFFDPHREVPGGRCRRNGPVVGGDWPLVAPDDWCGEYKTAIRNDRPVVPLGVAQSMRGAK